ncbi:MAG: UvrD-helicase domain-containing protein, partial [Porticoccaceae bacterium]|nr:UvrD-helicase domain-containing protein [Porticoccaceae bacterium]
MTTQPADHQQRQQALDPSRSFAVAAPAGSGKTGLLTQRVLTLLAGCQHPEEVLAITFTRKAAAEMRHRIVDALQTAQTPEPPQDSYQRQTWELARKVLARDSELSWQLLTATSRLRIQTIDGLCRHLARQLVLENGLGELPQPSDNPDALYREAVRELFQEL